MYNLTDKLNQKKVKFGNIKKEIVVGDKCIDLYDGYYHYYIIDDKGVIYYMKQNSNFSRSDILRCYHQIKIGRRYTVEISDDIYFGCNCVLSATW